MSFIKTPELKGKALEMLEQRGIQLMDIAKVVHTLQDKYIPGLTLNECLEHVIEVMDKREVLYAVLTGLTLDMLADQKLLPEPLQSIIENDEPLYGIDETIALGIVNVFGSIGITNFGYADKRKYGIIKELDEQEGQCNTYSDDIVAAIASSAAGRMAHRYRDKLETE
ncbi:phosphatidylglycerophosphatase A (plasmid) [Rossellomorea sp. AcN35-11]|nr:phosphatidylglycerophosphatase A [Rossellomorea aquimaris]WJV32119.1 phosphatidylglycerophosphatase A [Rossellomorea sp. AcN35-11]